MLFVLHSSSRRSVGVGNHVRGAAPFTAFNSELQVVSHDTIWLCNICICALRPAMSDSEILERVFLSTFEITEYLQYFVFTPAVASKDKSFLS